MHLKKPPIDGGFFVGYTFVMTKNNENLIRLIVLAQNVSMEGPEWEVIPFMYSSKEALQTDLMNTVTELVKKKDTISKALASVYHQMDIDHTDEVADEDYRLSNELDTLYEVKFSAHGYSVDLYGSENREFKVITLEEFYEKS